MSPSYENLVQINTSKKVKKKKLTQDERGCENCPARKGFKYGYGPVMGRVEGKRLFIWAQNPGKTEVRKKKELIGPTGEILWHELKKFGVKRKNCDIQNVVRCLPTDKDSSGYRVQRNTPNKEELHCCSIYTEKALARSKAKVILILGLVAARQVLGKEYKKNVKIFWSENLKAKVIITSHPAYFLYSGKKGQAFKDFQATLKLAAEEAFGKKIKAPKGLENFRVLLKQKYIKVETTSEAKRAYKDIRNYAIKHKQRIACDFEWHKDVGLVYGFSPRRKLTYVFILDHPKNLKNKDLKKVKKYTQLILEDKKIRKIFHHGCSDLPATYKIYGWKIRGFDYDSELGAYFFDSSIKAYGLSRLAERWFPEFAGYKEVTMPEALPAGADYKKGRKLGTLDYSRVPIDKLVLYNGADNDLSKRIENMTKGVVNMPLMHVYKDASFTIDKMQRNGPLLDYRYHEELTKIFPVMVSKLKKKIQKICKHKELNPNSSPQLLPIIYDEMGLEPPTIFVKGKEVQVKNCRATTLELINEENPTRFISNLLTYKWYNALNTKGLKSFKKSADLHDGLLRTTWWLTGTITFRLRSGGGGQSVEEKEKGIINLQNVPKDKMIKNLIISDDRWYEVQDEWNRKVFHRFQEKYSKWKILFDIDEKKKERTPDALELTKLIHEFKNIDYRHFEDLYTFMAFDYSQMEVRVLAQMSEDPKLIEFFIRGIDIHSAIGAELTGWTIERIINDADTRATVKSIIFAIIYGKRIKGLYQQLINAGVKISFARVEELFNAFWKKFKRVKELLDSFIEQAEESGYVETLFGARRPISEDDQRNTFTENQAVNTPIQGTAHQISVIAMALLERQQEEYRRLQRLHMEVHDQLVFGSKIKYLPESNVKAKKLLTEDVITVMKDDFGIKWKVPLKADGESGFRLGTMVKLGKEVDLKYWINEFCLLSEARNRDVRKELAKVN